MKVISCISKITILAIISNMVFSGCTQRDPDQTSRLNIDINKKADPIEKYIYGQFIEHLGRCIYGGIWAEMIEDRKFYYPVKWEFDPYATDTDPFWNTGPYPYLKASPWEVIGNENTVTMDDKDPFTGNHTPLLSSSTGSERFGIKQGGLGLLSGQSYEGRIILAGDESVLPIIIRVISKINHKCF